LPTVVQLVRDNPDHFYVVHNGHTERCLYIQLQSKLSLNDSFRVNDLSPLCARSLLFLLRMLYTVMFCPADSTVWYHSISLTHVSAAYYKIRLTMSHFLNERIAN
jgi:hypothetical protein